MTEREDIKDMIALFDDLADEALRVAVEHNNKASNAIKNREVFKRMLRINDLIHFCNTGKFPD